MNKQKTEVCELLKYDPISFPYQVAHATRIALYKLLGLYHKNKLPVPVISIGNISFGGTGKTPITIAIAKFFASKGYKVAILSRGYKAKNLGTTPLLISSKKFSAKKFTAQDIGDEPCEMLEAFANIDKEIVLALGAKRYQSGLQAIKEYGCNLVLLDDGLQHINLDRDVDIVLKNINERGFHREFPILAEKKADYLIYTKVNDQWQAKNKNKISCKFNLSLNKNLDPNKQIGIFTGIADPKTFMQMITEKLVQEKFNFDQSQVKTWFFPDHHQFNLDEVTKVLSLGMNIISTRKDLVRIPEEFKNQFIIADLELDFNPKDFLEKLLNSI